MTVLSVVSRALGIDDNQVYFLVCQSIAVICGIFLRCRLSPESCSSKLRHWLELSIGVLILYLGYGSSIVHLFLQSVPAYIMLVFMPISFAQYGILLFSMSYLSAVHIYQLITNNYSSVDITAPLMVQTQKLSSLAFNISDGIRAKAGVPFIRDYHKLNAIDRRPRLLQLGGYLFCFHNCMVGPFMFFSDYLRFIEGREGERLMDASLEQRFLENKDAIRKAMPELRKQLKLLGIHAILTVWALSKFRADQFLSEEFAKKNIFQKYIFLSIACFGFRQRFYFAWTLSCIANLTAGFGFSGFDHDGQAEYRLATNIHFTSIELGTSTKSMFDAWNTATTRWLRECIYDRVPKQYAVWAVFVASAVWHGFYPGFYLAFISAAFLTMSGRVCRQYLRPYFLGSHTAHVFYDILTHLGAMFCLNYLGVAFFLQKTYKVLYFWRQMRFIGHLVPLILLVSLPLACNKPMDRVVRMNSATEQTRFEACASRKNQATARPEKTVESTSSYNILERTVECDP